MSSCVLVAISNDPVGQLDPSRTFEVRANVDRLLCEADKQALSRAWLTEDTRRRYTYNFSWLGRPVIQLPQDLLAVQELIWQVRPDLIVETGIAHGGSLIHSASLLEILGGDGIVVGVDVDIRAHNRREIEAHPLARRIRLIEGSSTDEAVAAAVREQARGRRAVMVILDSNHTHDHVRKELALYAPLVTRGSSVCMAAMICWRWASDPPFIAVPIHCAMPPMFN